MNEYHPSTGKYHVSAGLFGIYAGIISKDGKHWKDKSDVTDEAIESVRDYMVDKALDAGEASHGWEWTMTNGDKVELRLTIKEADNGG